jgi:Fe-S-cluster containining protein
MSTMTTQMPEILRQQQQLGPDDSFCFKCHPGRPCFGDCCGDVNILLTPVDVLRLARRLGITTREFLDSHTLMPITKDLHLPVVLLRMGNDPGRRCPFVNAKGCSVYEDRPWACRMYPLGMALPPARAGVTPEPVYFVFKEDFCRGGDDQSAWTAKAWRADQDLDARDALEAGFQEIVSHPWFIGGRQLDPRRMDMYFTACYDLDTFRGLILSPSFLRRFELEEGLVAQLAQDDEALLRFAFRWLRFALFAEPTMRVRAGGTAPREMP